MLVFSFNILIIFLKKDGEGFLMVKRGMSNSRLISIFLVLTLLVSLFAWFVIGAPSAGTIASSGPGQRGTHQSFSVNWTEEPVNWTFCHNMSGTFVCGPPSANTTFVNDADNNNRSIFSLDITLNATQTLGWYFTANDTSSVGTTLATQLLVVTDSLPSVNATPQITTPMGVPTTVFNWGDNAVINATVYDADGLADITTVNVSIVGNDSSVIAFALMTQGTELNEENGSMYYYILSIPAETSVGTAVISVNVTDRVGNYSNWSTTFTITENLVPANTINTVVGDTRIGQTAIANVTWADNLALSSWYGVTNATGSNVIYPVNRTFTSANESLFYIAISIPVGGAVGYAIFANDTQGNQNVTPWQTITVTNTNPNAPSLSTMNNSNYTAQPTLNWTNATDVDQAAGGDNLTHIITIGTDPLFDTITAQSASITGSYLTTGLADGLYFWKVNVTDANGGSAQSGVNIFTIDTTGPVVTPVHPFTNVDPRTFNYTDYPLEVVANITDSLVGVSSTWFVIGEKYGPGGCELSNSSAYPLSFDTGVNYTGTMVANFTSPFTGPGDGGIYFCANDTLGNVDCNTNLGGACAAYILKGANSTQIENQVAQFSNMTLLYENGSEIPDVVLADPTRNNMSMVMRQSDGTFIFEVNIIGFAINESLMEGMDDNNMSMQPSDEINNIAGSGMQPNLLWFNASTMLPSNGLMKYGVFVLPQPAYDKLRYCTGSPDEPSCSETVMCNATVNTTSYVSVLSESSQCYTTNTSNTVIYSLGFSGAMGGTDNTSSSMTINSPTLNSVGNSSITINFTITDANGSGVNVNKTNVSINGVFNFINASVCSGPFYDGVETITCQIVYSDSDGIKTIAVYTQDNSTAGNINVSTTSAVLDRVAPVAQELVSSASSVAQGDVVSFLVNFTDATTNISGVRWFQDKWNGSETLLHSNTSIVSSEAGTVSVVFNYTLYIDGDYAAGTSYNITAYTWDAAGNTVESNAVMITITDGVAPGIAVNKPTSSNVGNSSTVNFTVTDAGGINITSVTVSINGTVYIINSSVCSAPYTNGSTTLNCQIDSAASDGLVNISISAKDTAHNQGSSATAAIIDTVDPIASTLSASASTVTQGSAVNFSVSVLDANTNVSGAYWYVSRGTANESQLYANASVHLSEGANTTFNLTVIIGGSYNPGSSYDFSLVAFDSAGNDVETNAVTILVQDGIAPTYNSFYSTGNNRTTTVATLYANWSDNSGDLDAVCVEVNTSKANEPTNVSCDTSVTNLLTYSYTLNRNKTDIIYWRTWANDSSGNLNSTPWQAITVLNTPPSVSEAAVTLTKDSSLAWVYDLNVSDADSADTSFTWTVNDTTLFNYSGDSGVINHTPNQFHAGTHSVLVTVSDGSETNTTLVTYTVTDVSSPVVTSISPSNLSWLNLTQSLNFTTNESLLASTVVPSNIAMTDSTGASVDILVSYTASTNRTTIDPYAKLKSGENYTIVLGSGLTDANGVALGGSRVYVYKAAYSDLNSNGVPDWQEDLNATGDTDGDGVNNSVDYTKGDNTTIETNLAVIVVEMNGSNNVSQLNGTYNMNITNGTDVMISVEVTVDNDNPLDFTNLTISKVENDTFGGTVISGLKLPAGTTKSIWVDNRTPKNGVCILDAEVPSVNFISDNCNATGETFVACPGAEGSYTCVGDGEMWKVSGLSHSAVKQDDDNTPPVVTITQAATSTATTRTFSVTTDENAVCKGNLDSDIADYNASGWSYAFSGAGTKSHSIASGTLAVGTHTLYVKCNDSYFNKNAESKTMSFTVSATSSGSTTSSGYSSGFPSTVTSNVAAKKSKQWGTIASGETVEMDLDEEEIAFSKVSFSVDADSSQVVLEVKSFTGQPSEVTVPGDMVYQYLRVETEKDDNVDSVKIDFKVPKSWLASNGIADDGIVLHMDSGDGWKAITTYVTSSDSEYVYYRAKADHFSYFAVVGTKAAPVAAPAVEDTTEEPVPEETAEEPAVEPAPEVVVDSVLEADYDAEAFNKKTGVLMLLVVVLLAGVYWMFLIAQKKPKTEIVDEKKEEGDSEDKNDKK